MASSSNTKSSNNINSEGTISNIKNDIKEGLNSTINNNEEHVTVFVAYDGKWELDGKEWLFKEAKGSIMAVSKYVTLSQITDILCEKFDVDQDSYGLKLEVYYRVGFPIVEIECDEDLSLFISESTKTKLLLCVTAVRKDDVAGGVEEDENNPDIEEDENYPDIEEDENYPDIEEDENNPDIKEDKINPDIEESPHGRQDDRVEKRLIKAIRKNDWVKARQIVNTGEVTWTSKLNDIGVTALHYAVGNYKDNEVVRDILRGINNELLVTTVTNNGRTPAHHAANFGNTEALKIMLDSNRRCLIIPDKYGFLPIHNTLLVPAINTFLYLFKQMKSNKDDYDILFSGMHGPYLLHRIIDAGIIDVAYELINDHPSLATTVYEDKTAVECIIRKPELFYSGTHNYSFYSRFVYHIVPIENNSLGGTNTADVENQNTPKKDKFVPKYRKKSLHDVTSRIYVKLWETTLLHVPHVKHLRDDKVKHNTTIKLLKRICKEADGTHTLSDIERLFKSPFFLAVENNTTEAVDVLTTYFKGLYNYKKDGANAYQLTVLNRSERVYSYIKYHSTSEYALIFKLVKDDGGNNILHMAGCLAPMHKLNAASGAALQMQRELQWFEELKRVVGITQTRELNKNKETPMMVFRKEHKELRKDGEEWMKKTADSYTITAALIITIVFAAAITVPGGNDSATGKPIYETKASLIVFAISDAISLFTSTTSLLLFLSILTARYADEDFLYKLPKRLIYGLVMLFVSVTSMMIAFSATLYIMFGQEKEWILIPVAALACLPIASFVTLQFPLLVELISSTYGHGYFGKEKDYRQSSANANKKKRT